MSWPSSTDPWYLANTTDNNARRTYYGVNGVPAFYLDGAVLSPYSSLVSAYNLRKAVASPIWMSLSPRMNTNGRLDYFNCPRRRQYANIRFRVFTSRIGRSRCRIEPCRPERDFALHVRFDYVRTQCDGNNFLAQWNCVRYEHVCNPVPASHDWTASLYVGQLRFHRFRSERWNA